MTALQVHFRSRRPAALCLAILLYACTLPAGSVRAAFELKAVPPAERGCSNPDALGLVDGSVSATYHPRPGSGPACVAGAYAYRPFGLAALHVADVHGRLTLSGKRVGLNIDYTALTAPGYGESVLKVSLGISSGALWIQPGLRFGRVTSQGGYNGRAFMFDLLIYSYIARTLRVSFEAGNALASGLNVPGGSVPSRLGAGVGYAVSGAVACALRIEKESGLRTTLLTGIEWRAARGFFLRLGSSTFPRELSMGLGLRLRRLTLGISSTANLDLGVTHAAGATYYWN